MSAPLDLPSTFIPGWHDEDAVRCMKYNTLGRTGRAIYALTIGGAGFGGVYEDCADTAAAQAAAEIIEPLVRAGINMIDTAPWYGQGRSETVIGAALKAAAIPRESLYIHTKVGRYEQDPLRQFDFTAARVRASVQESLDRLQVTYLDVVQIHDPEFAADPAQLISETLPALAELKAAGVIRGIGITGYPLHILRYLVEHCPADIQIDTTISYARYTVHDTTLADSGTLKLLADAVCVRATLRPTRCVPAHVRCTRLRQPAAC